MSSPLDPRNREDQSIGELVSRLTDDVRTLVRDEIRLAQLEIKQKGKQAGMGAGMLGTAGVIAFFAVGTLIACAVLALALVMEPWLAALIVGVVLLIIAGIVALLGRSRLRRSMPPVPEEAMQGARDDIETMRGGSR